MSLEMNLSEHPRARSLALVVPTTSEAPVNWKSHATKALIIAIGIGTYYFFFRKKPLIPYRWAFFNGKCIFPRKKANVDDRSRVVSQSRQRVAYNHEICPICLGAPKTGLRAPCGHLLCAICLSSYCEARITSLPPPCPLCRAPFVSVTLATDQIQNPRSELDANVVDSATMSWIEEYNSARGLVVSVRGATTSSFHSRRVTVYVNLILIFSVIGIATNFEILPWNDWIACGSLSVLMVTFLAALVWYKHRENAAIDVE